MEDRQQNLEKREQLYRKLLITEYAVSHLKEKVEEGAAHLREIIARMRKTSCL